MNGTFKYSVVVAPRHENEIYYPLENFTLEFIDDIEEFNDLMKKYYNKRNVLIDSRLIKIIFISFLNFNDSLVYNVHLNIITNACEFINSANVFNLNNNLIHTKNGNKLIYIYLFVNYVLKMNIPWSINKAMNNLNKITNIVELLLNYIGVKNMVNDLSKCEKYIKEIENICHYNFSKKINTIMDDVDVLYTALVLLIKKNYLIKSF